MISDAHIHIEWIAPYIDPSEAPSTSETCPCSLGNPELNLGANSVKKIAFVSRHSGLRAIEFMGLHMAGRGPATSLPLLELI